VDAVDGHKLAESVDSEQLLLLLLLLWKREKKEEKKVQLLMIVCRVATQRAIRAKRRPNEDLCVVFIAPGRRHARKLN